MKIQKKQEIEFFGTKTGNANSIALGYATETKNFGEVAVGIMNKSTAAKDPNSPKGVCVDPDATLFSVGYGGSEERKNALEVKGDGSVMVSGKNGDINVADKIKQALDTDASIKLVMSAENSLQYTLMVNDEPRGSIDIPKDQFLKNVTYDSEGKQLVFTFVTLDEDEHVEKVPVGDLKDIYKAGDGITINGDNVISADFSSVMTAISDEKTQRETTDNEIKSTLDTKADKTEVATLQTKVYEHDNSITELQTKVGVGIELLKHPVFKEMTDTSVVISEVTTSSSITDGTYYPILKNNKPHGEVSDLWRFSLPVQPNSGVYPKEYGIEVIRPYNMYLTTEFYFEGTEFEIREPANLSSYLIVDDVVVGTLSNTTDKEWVYQKVTFSESKKRHIRIRSSFYGINTNGIISKCEKKRMLLAVDGDSITEGTACIRPRHSEYAWSVRVAEILDCDLNNGGVGGSGYVKTGSLSQANMVDRYDSYIGQLNPDILFVMGGLNDGEATQDWKTAVDQYWEHVNNTFKGKYVIVASPYWPQTGKNDNIENMTNYLKGVALKYKYPFVDVYNGITYDAMGQIIATNSNGGLVNSTNYNILYKEYVEGTQTDNTHINNVTGHEYVGRYIANEVYRICKDDFGINL